eukprot:m.96107 g.96107  ORF g.96107 m.96107 type:complete len:456 (-) comp15042_c0_seq8:23-1390(-)
MPRPKASQDPELLAFGYESKLFRDDAAAQAVNEGKTLVPWQGNDTLMVDRYDVRLLTYDIDLLEMTWDSDFEDDESQFDDERYHFLNRDVSLFEDEARKRRREHNPLEHVNLVDHPEGGAAVPPPQSLLTSHEDDDNPNTGPTPDLDLQADKTEITMSASLADYEGETPHTQKQYNAIEKTALFLSKQSAQMMIVLRTKQQNNPWMQFLEPSHRLHPLYQALAAAIAKDDFQPGATEIPTDNHESLKDTSPSPSHQDAALPGLGAYDSSDDSSEDDEADPIDSIPAQGSPPRTSPPTSTTKAVPNILESLVQAHAHEASELLDQQLNPPKKAHVTPAPLIPVAPWLAQILAPSVPPIAAAPLAQPLGAATHAPHSTVAPWSLPASSNSVVPPPEDKQVVDKFAKFVAKNGPAFEETTRARNGNDPRFAFLQPWNPYYSYYKEMVAWWSIHMTQHP